MISKNIKNFFKDKKVTVMGLGLLGRGVGDAAFLAECGAKLTITDLKSSQELRPSLKKLGKYKNIRYVLGEHRLEDFRDADMILKAAGVPINSPHIKEALKNKIPVEMSGSLFAKYSGLPMIGVTGTRGKSTVTHMIVHILKAARKEIIIGGNIRGVSNLQLLKEVKGKEVAVFELDSWQLQGFGDNQISPEIAVFTTFFGDHMSYYGRNMKKYFLDKAKIFQNQKPGDVLVIGSQVLPYMKKWGGTIKSKIISPKSSLGSGWKVGVPGEHNIYNAVLARDTARVFGIKDVVIKKALATFKGTEGRMELVREFDGVKYYNDTTATTPEATIAALRTLGQTRLRKSSGEASKNIVLIAGGFDKGLNMNSVLKEIHKYCKNVVLLSGTGTDRIKNKIKDHVEVYNMKKAVTIAKEFASSGDVVLMSPAFSSFGLFNNEYDRGDQFNKIIKSLK